MLPGFNNNDQFMAIEGFTNSFHNRSDEAFTVSDLEEFKAANNVELPSVRNTTSNTKPYNNTEISKQNTDDENNAEEELNNGLNTKTTRPTTTRTKTTRPTTTRTKTTRPATTRTKTTRPTTTRTKTTRPTTTRTTKTKMLASNVDEKNEEEEYFKDLNPETSDANTTEMEDPEMEDPEMEETDLMNEIKEDIETPTEEENIESEMNDKLSENTGKNESVMEGFAGSRLIDEKWLNTLLKSLLLTFMVYVLIHPSTGKVLSKVCCKSGVARDLIASGIFFVVCYIVIMVL
jgi:hypothetical protein